MALLYCKRHGVPLSRCRGLTVKLSCDFGVGPDTLWIILGAVLGSAAVVFLATFVCCAKDACGCVCLGKRRYGGRASKGSLLLELEHLQRLPSIDEDGNEDGFLSDDHYRNMSLLSNEYDNFARPKPGGGSPVTGRGVDRRSGIRSLSWNTDRGGSMQEWADRGAGEHSSRVFHADEEEQLLQSNPTHGNSRESRNEEANDEGKGEFSHPWSPSRSPGSKSEFAKSSLSYHKAAGILGPDAPPDPSRLVMPGVASSLNSSATLR